MSTYSLRKTREKRTSDKYPDVVCEHVRYFIMKDEQVYLEMSAIAPDEVYVAACKDFSDKLFLICESLSWYDQFKEGFKPSDVRPLPKEFDEEQRFDGEEEGEA